MRRTLLLLAVAAVVLAGCGSDSEDDAAEDIPAPGASTATTMGMGGGEHADHGGGGGEATASCSPSGTTVSVVAQNTTFNSSCLAAPADQQFTLSYENKDSIGHNIVFVESHTATEVMFRADIFTGPKTSTFTVGPLKAGNYAFHCEVHPSVMKGTFLVK